MFSCNCWITAGTYACAARRAGWSADVDAAVPDLTARPDPALAPATDADPAAALITVLGDLRDRYAAFAATPGLDDAVLAALRRRTHAAGLERVAAALPPLERRDR